MSYHIHHLEGFILWSANSGEANKIYYLFTEELGLILAKAQSVRAGKSKLKGHLENYSLGYFSVIRGKEFWRLTGAENISRLKGEELILVSKIFNLLKRLLHWEESVPYLFVLIKYFFQFLNQSSLSEKEKGALEKLTAFRLLHLLGYIKKSALLDILLKDFKIEQSLLNLVLKNENKIIEEINRALQVSHL